jgi:hypothetical protein
MAVRERCEWSRVRMRTGVRRYVCFGGRLGQKWGIDRRELGIVGGEPSSSDESSLGGGDLRPAGSKVMDSLIVVDPLKQILRGVTTIPLQHTSTPQLGKL